MLNSISAHKPMVRSALHGNSYKRKNASHMPGYFPKKRGGRVKTNSFNSTKFYGDNEWLKTDIQNKPETGIRGLCYRMYTLIQRGAQKGTMGSYIILSGLVFDSIGRCDKKPLLRRSIFMLNSISKRKRYRDYHLSGYQNIGQCLGTIVYQCFCNRGRS